MSLHVEAPVSSCAPIPWSTELETLARRYAERIAVRDDHGTLSYAALHQRAVALARALVARCAGSGIGATSVSSRSSGSSPGCGRIGILLRNSRAAIVADYAVSIAGGCIVHLNPAYSPADLDWCLHLAPIDCLITEEALLDRVEQWTVDKWLMEEDGCLTAPRRGVFLPETDSAADDLPAVDPAGEARVIFTSGSSGPPKAAVYSHRQRWMAATVLRSVLPYRPGARSGIALMTPYVHGASALARAYLDCGSCVEIMDGINRDRLRAGIQDQSFDAIFAPPSVLGKLAELLEGERYDHIRSIFTGTQPLAPGVYQRAAAIFGACMRVTYGKTENLNPITVLESEEVHAVYQGSNVPTGTCVGHPGPGVELRLTPAGEVELRSQHQFCGYLTATGFQPHAADAWHATGDLGEFDESGRLWLKGRNTDTINTGGYMVSPDEVESLLSTATAVGELCVFGIPSEYWGEVSVCVYVAAGDRAGVETELLAVSERLTKYKRPRAFVAVESLAKTPAGKIDRRENRKRLLAKYHLVDGPYPSLTGTAG